MLKRLRRLRELILLASETYLLWGWLSGKGIAMGNLHLQPPEYAALILLIAGLLVLPVWNNRPSVRFGRLADELRQQAQLYELVSHDRIPMARRLYWNERLAPLKIKTPPIDSGQDEWKAFLCLLAPQALDQRIRAARRLQDELRASPPLDSVD